MPLFLLSISLLMLSQSAIFIRVAEAPAPVIGFWRLIIACPLLFLLMQWRGKSLRSIKGRDIPGLFVCAAFLFAHWYTWVLSIQNTSTANAIILFCSNPLYVAVGAWVFFRERVDWRHALSLGFCFLGIFVMVRGSLSVRPEQFKGDMIGFLSSVLFAAYVLSSKGIRKRMDNMPFSLSLYLLSGLGFFLVASLQGVPLLGYAPKSWAMFAALGLGSTLLGHSLFTYCLNFFNVNLMSVSTLSEPILTALVAYWLFDEPVRGATLWGFVLVTTGILVLYWPHLRGVFRRPA